MLYFSYKVWNNTLEFDASKRGEITNARRFKRAPNFILPMKKTLLICLTLGMVLMIGGCKEVKRGVVTEKWYEPARHYTTCHYVKTGKYGGYTQCIPHFDDEDFMIRVSDVEGSECFMESEKLRSRESYDFVQIGDSFFRDSLGQMHFKHN